MAVDSIAPEPPCLLPLLPGPKSKPRASNGGHGTLEMLQVSRLLEGHGICCCMVGVSALKFYGAARIRDEWEVCVASEQLESAIETIQSNPAYVPELFKMEPQPHSLYHTYTRFCGKELDFRFVLVSSDDAHLQFDRSTIWRSLNGLPYPSLPTLVQSFLDTHNDVDLCDIIDGANLTQDWGDEHLQLDGPHDLKWATRMNARVHELEEREGVNLFGCTVPMCTAERRELWEFSVGHKTQRIGIKLHEVYRALLDTRFRLKDTPDPWTIASEAS